MSPLSRRALLQSLAGFCSGGKTVNLLATVRDRKGQFLRDLNQADFTLDDDGRPQTIRCFSPAGDLPVTLGLLVDTGTGQRGLIGQERQASSRFFEQVLREGKDQAFLIHFDHAVEQLGELTASRKELEQALRELESVIDPPPLRAGGNDDGRRRGHGVHGGTSLYDAIHLAADELMRKQTGRKALVVISDGVDTASRMTLEASIETAQRADTVVYCILFSDREARREGRGGERPNGRKVLERISRETGGEFQEVTKREPLDAVFSRIPEILRNQYSLGFTPDRAAEGYHLIHLSVNRKDLVVETRAGYFAQP